MRRMLAGIVLAALGAASAHAFAARPSDVKAALVADVTAVKAGMPFTLAVVLTTNPDWHIYWKNPGDAGSATAFKFRLPEGYKVDEVQFPLPRKFTQSGDITSYGYAGTTVFLATVTPPETIDPASKVTLNVDVSWLSCKEVCVPGGAKLSLELPASPAPAAPPHAGGPRGDNQDLIAKARSLMPESTPPKDVVEPVQVLNNDKNETSLRLAWKKQPKGSVEVFPLTPEGVEVSDIRVNNEGDATRIVLKWRQLAGVTKPPAPLPLLVTYTDDKGERHGFFSTMDLATLAMPQK